MTGAMREVIHLANAEGVALGERDMEEYIELLKTLSPEGMPSMRQDGIANRPSEVELFSGICEMERGYAAIGQTDGK